MTDELDAKAEAEGRAAARRLSDDLEADGRLEAELRPTVWGWVKTERNPQAFRLGAWSAVCMVASVALVGAGANTGQVSPALGTTMAVIGAFGFAGGVAMAYLAVQAGQPLAEAAGHRRNHLLETAVAAGRAELDVIRPRPQHPAPPAAQPYGVSHQGAEAFVADWMRHLGAEDVAVTRFSQDGGIDVTSTGDVAQVKNYAGSVGVQDLRAMIGTASLDGRRPLFFTSGSYTAESVRTADSACMPLFVYDAVAGTLTAANSSAETVLADGI